ncbi:MAG: TIGR02996 domain-containing protein, partial [Planctomycetales bacterium]
MDYEQAFLEEIVANPGDPAPRLIFADWLEERGDPRAEVIRLQHALLRIPGPPNRDKLEARMRKLLYRENVPPVVATVTNSLGMKFVVIPPGEFWMGSSDEERKPHGLGDETPRHPVVITRAFLL